MIEQIYLDKFNKTIDSYGISKSAIFDIVKAMSFSESFGSHPISLKALANSGIAYFAGIADKDGTLPDARLYRVLADSLAIALYMRDSSLVSDDILSKLSANVADVLSCAANYRGRPDYYKSAEECKDIIDALSKINDFECKEDIGKFIAFVANRSPVKDSFSGLVVDARYREKFKDAYFYQSIGFANKNENVFDSLTKYMLGVVFNSDDVLRDSILIATKIRRLNRGSRLTLKLTPDLHKALVDQEFVYNALSRAFTFTHVDSQQSVDSIILLYVLVFVKVSQIEELRGVV